MDRADLVPDKNKGPKRARRERPAVEEQGSQTPDGTMSRWSRRRNFRGASAAFRREVFHGTQPKLYLCEKGFRLTVRDLYKLIVASEWLSSCCSHG